MSLLEHIQALNFYETGMILSNSSSATLTFILLVLNIYWHYKKSWIFFGITLAFYLDMVYNICCIKLILYTLIIYTGGTNNEWCVLWREASWY
jgi:hypothetical protein